jgi:isopentenyldiphosphate isomerase
MTHEQTLAQDPDELFDVVTADGDPTGITKRRADVHHDGDWHRSIHIWIYGVDDGVPFLLMNQRGLAKDTSPGLLDAPVAGHLGAGETVADAFREMEEEVGIVAELERLRFAGTRPRAAEHTTPGTIDREIQEVFLYRDDRALTDYRPNPAELEGLVRLTLADALALFAGEAVCVPATQLGARDGRISKIAVTPEMLIPTRVDRYFLRVAVAIANALRGDRYVVV